MGWAGQSIGTWHQHNIYIFWYTTGLSLRPVQPLWNLSSAVTGLRYESNHSPPLVQECTGAIPPLLHMPLWGHGVHKVNCTLTLPAIGMLLLCIVYKVTVTGRGAGGDVPHAYSEWEVKPSPAAQRIKSNIKKMFTFNKVLFRRQHT
jgi:hypothetical protein